MELKKSIWIYDKKMNFLNEEKIISNFYKSFLKFFSLQKKKK